ncbi:hypothetical protein [Bacteroides sp. 224]|uniref:hypothetical protein n=1 Tax=Bacteroides sp. 224 TaxID=2302936 RepID=UPI0013D7C074|nr:hypothetical protein [Bacteroides sp. 224]NDV64135.1 hypothetical protein [Bacteroides sp. 224]
MKQLLKAITLLTLISCLFIACGGSDDNDIGDGGNKNEIPGKEEEEEKEEKPKPIISHITPIGYLNQGTFTVNSHVDVVSRSSLMMNYRTYVQPGESALGVSTPHYPRIKKMLNGSYIMFYHNNQIGASCYYAISWDLQTWSSKGKLFSNYSITDSKGDKNERRYSTCDGVVLANGDVLAVVSYRANSGYRELPKDAGLELRRSKDNGLTWGDPIQIYQGVNWEPYLLQLPSGEIHCYFTDSSRTGIEGKDTGTAMVVSKDGGQTWTPSFGNIPYYVLRMKWTQNGKTYFNHQMPSVIKLNGNNELAAAVETNYLGTYYISLAYSGEDGEWEHLNADQEGPEDSKNRSFEGSAPYLVQFPSGETVLSYNKSSTFYMKMGDATARNFKEVYAPFSGKGFWGSLGLIGSHQIVGTMPNTDNKSIMMAQFILNHQIDATQRDVKVDGDNSEWATTDHALFVGSKSQAQGTLRCSCDKDSVYFLVEVLDRIANENDYATIYISPVTENDKLTNAAYRINVSRTGLKSTEVYGSTWGKANLGVSAVTVLCDASNSNKSDQYGYVTEISIPRSKLRIESGKVMVNFSISDSQGGEEAISSTSSTSTAKWIPIIGL